MQNVLLMIVLIPVIAALLILPLKARAHAITRSIGMLGSLLSALFALAAYIAFQRSDAAYQFVLSVPWATINNAFAGTPLTITFAFAVDGISLPLVMLTGIVSVMAALRSFRVTERVKAHYVWQMLLVSGLYGVFAAADLFTFFFFLEVTLVASFFLILIFGQERREYAAFKFLIYRGIASVFLLLGFVGLAYALANSATTVSASQYMAYGPNFMSLNLLQLLDESVKAPLALGAQTWLFFVFLFAVLIEEAFVPFHTWLIDTHEQSDTSTNMLIGGVLMKVGLYIMLRFVVFDTSVGARSVQRVARHSWRHQHPVRRICSDRRARLASSDRLLRDQPHGVGAPCDRLHARARTAGRRLHARLLRPPHGAALLHRWRTGGAHRNL
ncbi:hypothetical protein AYJ22_07580 [Ferroacidibacillus organovorans]|nr:hypothetical protein AYJ22_07580 [Ferroacidibacillus organovorans]